MIPKNEMKILVDEIVEIGNELRKYHELEDKLAKVSPAPSKELLHSFKERFKGKFPPSYLQLISIYNGVNNFEWVDVSILSIEFLMSHDNLDEDWVDAGMYGEGELFIFAQSDSDAHVVAFLNKKIEADKEMQVVHFDAGGPLGEYQNLEAYFRDRRKWFEDSLLIEKSDRARFENDD
jgi:hypothetical protein